jgi:hypothetical protein
MNNKIDIRKTVAPKSDQLNADDLMGDQKLTIKITKVTGNDDAAQPVSIHFEGDNKKPYKPCKSMRRVMIEIWGDDTRNYIGKSLMLYRDPEVTFGGMKVGGIRISNMSDMKGNKSVTLALTQSKTNRKPYTVSPIITQKKVEHDPAVKKAGDDAAALGVEAYTAWLATLDEATKETVRQFHKEWSEKAKSFVSVEFKNDDDVSFSYDEGE